MPPSTLTGDRVLATGPVESVGIGTGVDGMTQYRQNAIVRGTTPFQLAAFRAAQAAITKLNLVPLEVAEHPPHRAQFLEFVEDQLDDAASLFIRFLHGLRPTAT